MPSFSSQYFRIFFLSPTGKIINNFFPNGWSPGVVSKQKHEYVSSNIFSPPLPKQLLMGFPLSSETGTTRTRFLGVRRYDIQFTVAFTLHVKPSVNIEYYSVGGPVALCHMMTSPGPSSNALFKQHHIVLGSMTLRFPFLQHYIFASLCSVFPVLLKCWRFLLDVTRI